MKKIEEKYLESEHQVRAYDVYLSSYRVKGANRVLAYSRLYDGDKFIRDNFLVNEQQADKIEAMFDLVNRILETCKDIDLFTIRVSNIGRFLHHADDVRMPDNKICRSGKGGARHYYLRPLGLNYQRKGQAYSGQLAILSLEADRKAG